MKPLYLIAALLIASATSLAGGDEWSIDWHTIDAGGELFSAGGDFELSGSIGQWDSTEARQLSGGPWQLTGGFWGVSLEELVDLLFSDRFQEHE